jgi:hypothetical protein
MAASSLAEARTGQRPTGLAPSSRCVLRLKSSAALARTSRLPDLHFSSPCVAPLRSRRPDDAHRCDASDADGLCRAQGLPGQARRFSPRRPGARQRSKGGSSVDRERFHVEPCANRPDSPHPDVSRPSRTISISGRPLPTHSLRVRFNDCLPSTCPITISASSLSRNDPLFRFPALPPSPSDAGRRCFSLSLPFHDLTL